jgi:hypothetical protein
MLKHAAQLYSEVFSPEYFVLLCAITLIVCERRATGATGRADLAARLGVLAGGWVVGLIIYKAGPAVFETPPTWAADATGSLGLGAAFLLIWLVWRLQDWGTLVPEFSLFLVAVTVPHLLITPFWDVSSHVIYALAPAGYLSAVERRFAPLLVVPAGMVFGRPLAGAHTWLESVGGLVLAGAFIGGLLYVRTRHGEETKRNPASDTTDRL